MTDPERRCIATGRSLRPEEGLRIVLDPQGRPALDFRQRLEGRGAWVAWEREALESVPKKGRLARAFQQEVVPPPPGWPLQEARAWLRKRQIELIGLAARAGELKSGGSVVERMLRQGWVQTLVLASDAGATVASDWERRAVGLGAELMRSGLDSAELATALGKDGARSVIALGEGPLARSLRSELKRGEALL